MAFIPGPSASPASGGQGPFVPVGDTNRDKRRAFCPGWCLQPGQKAPVPLLARLAVGPGTKSTYCPEPKGCRDKWPGTMAYSVVVTHYRKLLPDYTYIDINLTKLRFIEFPIFASYWKTK